MGHAHDHHHHHDSTYFIDQLCTVATCGLIGAVAILMYRGTGPQGQSKLSYILAPQFFKYVLIGGITIVVLAAIRGISLWKEVRMAANHSHEHNHEHDHAHDHEHAHVHEHHHDHAHHHHHDHSHEHAHAHDHDHGWTPARYAVLMIPIMLYFFNMPNSSFSAEYLKKDLASTSGELSQGSGPVADRGVAYDLGFKELTNAAYIPASREALEGKTGKIKGMFMPLKNDKEFTLFRLRMTCCIADAIPVGVRILSDENITQLTAKDWVEVEGQIQFRKLVGQDKYMPVMVLKSRNQVRKIPPQPDSGMD